MSRSRPFLALSALLTLASASPSMAQEVELTEAQAYDELVTLNADLRHAWERIPRSYGANPDDEQRALDEAEELVNGVIGRIQGRHRVADEAFATMQQNIARLRAQIRIARKAHAVSVVQALIWRKHQRGEAATPDELAAFNRHVGELATEATDDTWAATLAFFKDTEARHRQDADALSRLAAKRKEEARTAEQQAQSEAAMREANAARRAVEAQLESGAPADLATVRALQVAANKVAGFDTGAARFYLHQHQLLRLASALNEPDRQDSAELAAQALEGGLVSSGRAKGSALKVKFNVEADWCYAMAFRYHGEGEEGSWADFSLSHAKGSDQLQVFSIPQGVPGWQRLEGACTSSKGSITARAKLERGGQELRYAVVGWPRADVPPGLFAHVEVRPGDSCDFDGWVSLWEKPVPGSVVKVDGRPHLVTSVGRVGEATLRVLDVNGDMQERQKAELSTSRSGGAAPAYRFRGCPAEELATHSASKKLAKCYSKIERRHQRAIERARTAVDRARDDEARASAEAKLDQAVKAEEADRAKTCGPQERALAEDGRRSYEKILDLVERGEPTSKIDRAQVIADEERARPSLR